MDSPSGKSQLPTVFQLATVRKIFKALSNEDFQFQLLVLLAVTTGCREGELLGLSWDDYSSTDGTFLDTPDSAISSAERNIYKFVSEDKT